MLAGSEALVKLTGSLGPVPLGAGRAEGPGWGSSSRSFWTRMAKGWGEGSSPTAAPGAAGRASETGQTPFTSLRSARPRGRGHGGQQGAGVGNGALQGMDLGSNPGCAPGDTLSLPVLNCKVEPTAHSTRRQRGLLDGGACTQWVLNTGSLPLCGGKPSPRAAPDGEVAGPLWKLPSHRAAAPHSCLSLLLAAGTITEDVQAPLAPCRRSAMELWFLHPGGAGATVSVSPLASLDVVMRRAPALGGCWRRRCGCVTRTRSARRSCSTHAPGPQLTRATSHGVSARPQGGGRWGPFEFISLRLDALILSGWGPGLPFFRG